MSKLRYRDKKTKFVKENSVHFMVFLLLLNKVFFLSVGLFQNSKIFIAIKL